MPIRVLGPDIIGKIAAGEVVDRPASAVKELVENALDAGATSVQVELAAGGSDLIRVADNGVGIPAGELWLAVQRHATSKVSSAEDLTTIASLGFRGEALASIAAVSNLTLLSRPAGEGTAHQIRVEGGDVGPASAAARAPGSTVTVERLFFNVPARRKYLRSPTGETAQIASMLGQMAVAYPEVAFELVSEGRRLLSTPGTGGVTEAARAVLGGSVASALVPIHLALRGDGAPDDALALIQGAVAQPKVSRATRSGIWLFVNRRPVKNRSLLFAVEEAYVTLLQVGRHPVAIVDVRVPLSEVDVNIHPTKAEVRLLRERLVYGGLRDAVRGALVRSPSWGKELSGLGVPSAPTAGDETRAHYSSALLDVSPTAAPDPHQGMSVGGARLPILRLIGQVAQTYIVAEGEHGLYLIDQHAAHERVLLDRLLKEAGEGSCQMLMEPVLAELTAEQWEAAARAMDQLASVGYRLERFGERSLLIRGVPGELPPGQAVSALEQALTDLVDEKVGPDWRERIALRLSCRGAVKAGQSLTFQEMKALVEALEESTITQHCSHGRPTAVLLSHRQLEREFGR